MQFYLDLGSALLFIGAMGVLINRQNILLSIIAIELRLYGLNYYLGTVAAYVHDVSGLGFSLFVLRLAAAESALALGILRDYFRVFTDILIRHE
jgi:NADH-quinone oxidoreductase subunit K